MWTQWDANNPPEERRSFIMYIHEAWMAIIYRRNGSYWYAGTETKVPDVTVAQIKFWKYDELPQ